MFLIGGELHRRFDVLIRGGEILDGYGAHPLRADIGIVADRITEIGDLSTASAEHYLEAKGLHVAPGFIDIHTHSDVSASYDPGQASAIAMGVTTQVVGNCGLAIGFAIDSDDFQFERSWLAPHGARIRWNSFGAYLDQISHDGIATNYVPLAGHGTLRKRVMGLQERRPSAEDMSEMRRLLTDAMQSGAWGLSSGLEYPPSSYADETELTDLCRVVAEFGGFYATHLRNEGDTLVEAVREAMNVARGAGVPLQLSHHKAEGATNWGKVNTTLEMVDEARSLGQDVQLDQYPYTAFMTGLAIQLLPRWALSGSPEDTVERLRNPELRARITSEMLERNPLWSGHGESSAWTSIQIGVCRGRPELQGKSIDALAASAGKSPIEFALDLLTETKGYISAVNFAINETDIATVMKHPWTSIGSDGVATHPAGPAINDQIHPRTYGTFPRVLKRYVRELGILTEPQAIYKMTALPAARIGLIDRGFLRQGYFADVTVYDPAVVGDTATFETPHRFAEGIRSVLVNGEVALDGGIPTSSRSGAVLRRTERKV